MHEWIISLDPKVVDFWKTTATVVVAVVAAGIASAIQFRQWKTARDKLRLDLFERRFKVYEAIRTVLYAPQVKDFTTNRHVSEPRDFFEHHLKTLSEANQVLREARWLFGRDVVNLIEPLSGFASDQWIELLLIRPKPERVTLDRDVGRYAASKKRIEQWWDDNHELLESRLSGYLRIGR